MEKIFSSVTIELSRGNINDQPQFEAIVNAANSELRTGGGVAGAIHQIGDPELENETRPLAPISAGEAVITGAPNLPNKNIIHCLGPVYGKDEPSGELLQKCYIRALELAEEHNLSSIAFPAISTGAFGFPVKDAAQIVLQTIKEQAENLKSVQRIRFVLWKESDFKHHKEVLQKL